ncbi:MAG: hypothetical protein LC733_07920 [Actinobacteria bacterium]|nr:hypothetical protein [Actinomycetota bacterium]
MMALVGLMALSMAACGDDDDDEASQTSETTTAQPVGSASVTVAMSDYAYNVSGPLISGGTLRISNVGKEFHMMGLAKFKPGKTLGDLTAALSQGPPGGGGGPTTTAGGAPTTSSGAATTSSSTTTSGAQGGAGEEQDPTAEIVDQVGLPGNFMSPGESADVTVSNLTPGTYALVCFIPTEGEGSPHFSKGMINQLEVVSGTAPPAPTPDATYRVAPGQPVQGPANLTPGRHTLKFEAAAGGSQLEPGIARLNPGATLAQLDEAFVRLFESEEPPAVGAAGQVPGQVLFGGFDFEGLTDFTLSVDLRPGDYVIIAEDTDPEDRPKPPREILSLKVG